MNAEAGPRKRGDADRRGAGDCRKQGERDGARTIRGLHVSSQRTLLRFGCPRRAGQRPSGVVHRPPVIDAMIAAMLRETMPDVTVEVVDMTGTMDHLEVFVTTKAFAGVSALDRHRMVERALAPARADGRIHALQIRTATPEDTHG